MGKSGWAVAREKSDTAHPEASPQVELDDHAEGVDPPDRGALSLEGGSAVIVYDGQQFGIEVFQQSGRCYCASSVEEAQRDVLRHIRAGREYPVFSESEIDDPSRGISTAYFLRTRHEHGDDVSSALLPGPPSFSAEADGVSPRLADRSGETYQAGQDNRD